MAYKTCEDCGSRIFEYGCVNCYEEDYIAMQDYYNDMEAEYENTYRGTGGEEWGVGGLSNSTNSLNNQKPVQGQPPLVP